MAIINQIKTVLLLGILTAILLFLGSLFGATGLTIAIVFVVTMNLLTYFFSHKLVLMIYRAKEAKKTDYPRLHKTIEELAKEANIPKPKVYTIPTNNLNAFASGSSPKNAVVACTDGILKVLNHKELEGVLAHEISHIKNRDILITTIAATIGGIISYLAMIARFGAIFGGMGNNRDSGNIFALLALSILAPIAALIVQLAISRTREYQADASGAKLVKDGEPLASALIKLHEHNKHNPIRFGSPATSSLFITNPFSSSFLVNILSTHPDYKKRVERLKNMKF